MGRTDGCEDAATYISVILVGEVDRLFVFFWDFFFSTYTVNWHHWYGKYQDDGKLAHDSLRVGW